MTSAVHGIVAGYDGSPGSEKALMWSTREARDRGSVLTVCHAWALGYLPPAGESAAYDLARRSGERTLDRGLRYAQAVMGSSAVRPLLAEGAAARVLCESSAAAEMVVVGCWGHGGLKGSLLGSVSQKVAAHASGRVVVVRGHWRPAAGYIPGPVVVGVDGSAASQAAMEFAGEEAALRAVALVAVCAPADTPGNLGGARLLREDFGQVMADYEKNHPDLTVREQIADGSARAALLAAARDAQLLVVGSRGRGGLPGMPLGSVILAALYCAACPVGVVHPQ